mgnify:FL=1
MPDRKPDIVVEEEPGVPHRSIGEAERCDVAVVGCGAAGLMAAIWAGRAVREAGACGGAGAGRVVALDGARTLGAKILVAGGGRCNVTHDVVDPGLYAGASRAAVRKVLKRFDVPRTAAFFRELGVELKREPTGKLFPTTDKARTVLDALLRAAADAGVEVRHPWRVGSVTPIAPEEGGGFLIEEDRGGNGGGRGGNWGGRRIVARRVILATGGRSLPKSGSDGRGYTVARSLGHTVSAATWPALVPLTLSDEGVGGRLKALSGVSAVARLEVRAGSGRKLAELVGSTLCTHFGLSGPGPMDVSRYWTDARRSDPGARLVVSWTPDATMDALDAELLALGTAPVGRWLRERCGGDGSDGQTAGLPERLAELLCAEAGAAPAARASDLSRAQRKALARAAAEMVVPVSGDRGWNQAEVTAGGVPLGEVDLKTMGSRACPGLHLCGEVLDVDGRIGGYNFQWAWSSGFVAGMSVGRDAVEGAGSARADEPTAHEKGASPL